MGFWWLFSFSLGQVLEHLESRTFESGAPIGAHLSTSQLGMRTRSYLVRTSNSIGGGGELVTAAENWERAT